MLKFQTLRKEKEPQNEYETENEYKIEIENKKIENVTISGD